MSTWIVGKPSDEQLSHELLAPILGPVSRLWLLFVLFTLGGTAMLAALVGWSMLAGIGLFGNDIPAAWGMPIINFVWWIGIGHAGTFISAILLLLEQKWRSSINRFAEAMTLFAVLQAGLFPILHLGRPWFFYWLVPYPSTLEVWPQFKSALPWDAAAIFVYLTTSVLFWYLGLVPDLAAVRDRAHGRTRRRIYGVLALGWSGSAQAWRRFRIGYGLLAGIATPLVISVHSIVSADFAITVLPGWHSTIFPPYFVAGAILSGLALVLVLLVPARAVFGLQRVITARHLDAVAKLILVTGWIVLYAYIVEVFIAWYSGNPFERHQELFVRPFGPHAWITWITVVCNTLVVQVFWSRRARRSLPVVWVVALLVSIGMWCERFVLIDVSLERAFMVSKWEDYLPTAIDLGIFLGTLSCFGLLFLLFLRFVPFVPIYECKELVHAPDDDAEEDDDG